MSCLAPTQLDAQAGGLGNPAHDQMLTIKPIERKAALALSVRSAGERGCQVAGAGLHSFDRKSRVANWRADCADGRQFLVSIYPDRDGSTKVLDCKVLKAVAKVDC